MHLAPHMHNAVALLYIGVVYTGSEAGNRPRGRLLGKAKRVLVVDVRLPTRILAAVTFPMMEPWETRATTPFS